MSYRRRILLLWAASLCSWTPLIAAEPNGRQTVAFDADPKWDGFRNRLQQQRPQQAEQNFGYRTTNRAGGRATGEIGGVVQRSSDAAFYAMRVKPKTLDDRLHASGVLSVPTAGGGSGVMVGWFQAPPPSWRTPNSLAFRIDGNGGKFWVFYEYGTSRWRTGGGGAFEGERYQKTPTPPFPADGQSHRWSLDYDPAGSSGRGEMVFHVDDRTYRMTLADGHRADNARFDHFGIWNVQTPGDRLELYLDDLEVDGQRIAFADDPRWDAQRNDTQYTERFVRPFHDFGFSPTKHAGGGPGEIGGIVFRDERPSYYAAPIEPLTLDDELIASGRLSLNKAASDSGVYLGWFDSAAKQAKTTPDYEQPQSHYLAALLEGPSRAGHYFRPAYGTATGAGQIAGETSTAGRTWPVVFPDGKPHEFRIHYRPRAAGGQGTIQTTLDGQSDTLELRPGDRERGSHFDRFGIFNLQSGGHAVEIYLDDLAFTRRKAE
jgi:hypothetical protein